MRMYEVEFLDGRTAEFSANAVAEHMFTQCDPAGNQYLLLDSIIDHEIDDTAVTDRDRYVYVNGCKHYWKTTCGVKLCAQRKNGSTTWEQLIDLKQLYPLELAEYAIAQGINKTPAFAWWMWDLESKLVGPLVIVASYCCQDLLLNRALEIDKEDGNTLWQDAIAKEMANVRVAFKVLPDGSKEPVGHQYMDCHLVYEIKLD